MPRPLRAQHALRTKPEGRAAVLDGKAGSNVRSVRDARKRAKPPERKLRRRGRGLQARSSIGPYRTFATIITKKGPRVAGALSNY